MSWFSKLFGKPKVPAKITPRAVAGKRVALAVVVNPTGAIVVDTSSGGDVAGNGINAKMVRDLIDKDLRRYPELCAKAKAIQKIIILSNENISSSNYAQDMTQCYLMHVKANGWAIPEGLHIFESFLAQVTIFIAYGT